MVTVTLLQIKQKCSVVTFLIILLLLHYSMLLRLSQNLTLTAHPMITNVKAAKATQILFMLQCQLAHGFHFSFCAELWKGGEETTYPRQWEIAACGTIYEIRNQLSQNKAKNQKLDSILSSSSLFTRSCLILQAVI